MRFWYLATPYSRYPFGVESAFIAASRQAAILIKAKIPVFCPIAHTHPIAKYGEMDTYDLNIWLPADESFMESARGLIVCMLPSWEESTGIKHEMDFFRKSRKPIVYMVPGEVPNLEELL